MTRVHASITTSFDGYVTGPNDGPDKGLGDGGERLHYWVFGGPWSYDEEPRGEATGEDAAWLDHAMARRRRRRRRPLDVRGGRPLGRREPVGRAVLHRHAPAGGAAGGRCLRLRRRRRRGGRSARDARRRQGRHVMGGADVIRQALAAGLVDQLTIIVAPVVLGGGKRLFDGFTQPLELEHLGVRQSPFATSSTIACDFRSSKRSGLRPPVGSATVPRGRGSELESAGRPAGNCRRMLLRHTRLP